MCGFQKEDGRTNEKIVLRSLFDLHPHEETIRKAIDRLRRWICRKGVQLDPMIVDSSTGVILDGMHRYATLKELGLIRGVVYSIDYLDQNIGLKKWLICLKTMPDAARMENLRRDFSLDQMDEIQTACRRAELRESAYTLLTRKNNFCSKNEDSVINAYWASWQLLIATGVEFGIEGDSVSIKELLQRYSAVIYRPTVTKKEILRYASAGRLFPPKSTRHTVPERPMNIQFPIRILSREVLDKEAQDQLRSIINGRRLRRMHAGTRYRGRIYDEPITVFVSKERN
jgi:hypothetical protein